MSHTVEELTLPDAFKIYEDGKHRRYNLLFAVNGGAFALAKLLTERTSSAVAAAQDCSQKLSQLCAGSDAAVLGSLTLGHVAIGMIIFSAIMTADIFMFGCKMRKASKDFFERPGQVVVLLVGLLLCVGWSLVI